MTALAPETMAYFLRTICRQAIRDYRVGWKVALSQVLNSPPRMVEPNRLPPSTCAVLQVVLAQAGNVIHDPDSFEATLGKLRTSYEPFVNAMAEHLLLPLPR